MKLLAKLSRFLSLFALSLLGCLPHAGLTNVARAEVFSNEEDTSKEMAQSTECAILQPSAFAQKAEGIININGTQGGMGYYFACNHVRMSGLANLDGRYSNHLTSNTVPSFFGSGEGALYLNNANFLLDLNATQLIHAHVGIAYLDEDYNPFFSQYQRHTNRSFATFSQNAGIDELFVSVRDFDRSPFFIKAGRYFLPFGDQNQEPYPLIRSLPQLLTQVRDTAVESGFITQEGIYASGLLAHPAEDSTRQYPYEILLKQPAVHNFLARAGISKNVGEMDFNANTSLIWDTRSVQFIEDLYTPYLWTNHFQRASSVASHMDVTLGQIILAGDLIGLTSALIPHNKQTQPLVYGITGGYIFNFLSHTSVAHVSYQATKFASNLFINPNNTKPYVGYNANLGLSALPKWRIKADYGVEINTHVNIALEYVFDKAYENSFDKLLRSTHTVAARLSISI